MRKNTNRNKMRKIERQRIKGEKAKKGSIIQENDDLLGYYHELDGSFRVISFHCKWSFEKCSQFKHAPKNKREILTLLQ